MGEAMTDASDAAALAALRDEMAEVDREIVALIGRRQALAARVGELKQDRGIATRDFAQEKEVIERALSFAAAAAAPPRVVESVMRSLIGSSLATQEQLRVSQQSGGSGRQVLVIGGAGLMGRWFARFLASQGFEVTTADPAGPVEGFRHLKEWESDPLAHDLIVVATPLGITNGVLHTLAERKPAGIVFDVASLKSPLRSGLAALVDAGVSVTSVHPMFGPDTDLLSGRHVIFVDLGAQAATEAARELFKATMAVQVEMDLESHDRLIAYVLGLSHALNIAFVTALAESGEAAPELARLSSTTFDAQLSVAAKVSAENPDLYFEIQHLNDYGTESLAALLYAVERLRSVVRAGDRRGFVGLMERGLGYLRARPGEEER